MHRFTNQEGIDLIKRYEGFSPTVYMCPANYPTVGYGHVVLEHEDFSGGLTEKEGEELLQKDLRRFERAVLRYINVELTNNEFAALVSFTFNLGPGALKLSTLRKRVNSNRRAEAADELLRWVFAGGRKLRGLVLRREAERELFLY